MKRTVELMMERNQTLDSIAAHSAKWSEARLQSVTGSAELRDLYTKIEAGHRKALHKLALALLSLTTEIDESRMRELDPVTAGSEFGAAGAPQWRSSIQDAR